MHTEEFSPLDPSEELAERIAYLINGYLGGSLTEAEHFELDAWVSESMKNQQLFEELTDPDNINKWVEWYRKLGTEAALERVKMKLGFEQKPRSFQRRKFWFYWVAAAAIAIFVLFIFLRKQKEEPPELVINSNKKDLAPGGKHAILILSNGTGILLDTVKSASIQANENIQIRSDSSELFYAGTSSKENGDAMNELRTPPGGEYQVKLSDGTKVWLNASSSLKYPEVFSDSVRKVELIGEGYFEVSKDAAHPFIVQYGSNELRVLGTHFNINAYTDNREIIVTLAEGSIKLNNTALLKPGEQGSIDHVGNIKIEMADLETALAWKNGQFIFKETSLEQAMHQISHWYDARIIYQDNITEHFNAKIPRDVPASKLLHLLEGTGRVHFKIEDKTITVMN